MNVLGSPKLCPALAWSMARFPMTQYAGGAEQAGQGPGGAGAEGRGGGCGWGARHGWSGAGRGGTGGAGRAGAVPRGEGRAECKMERGRAAT